MFKVKRPLKSLQSVKEANFQAIHFTHDSIKPIKEHSAG